MLTTAERVFLYAGLGLAILGFICAVLGLFCTLADLTVLGMIMFFAGSTLARTPFWWNSLKD